MADLDHPLRVFPTVAEGFHANTVCVAYGTAGVVQALRGSGRDLPGGLLARLRADALAKKDELAPGLHAGNAGIARVLAAEGLIAEARDVLAAADAHPITSECGTLAGGASGVALAHLDLFQRTGDGLHLERASALMSSLPADADLTPYLGADDAIGLLHGRAGIALAMHQLSLFTGDDSHLSRAVRLLHAELDRASEPDAAGLLFPISATDRRAVPYLYAGTAGVTYAATRCLQATGDDRLEEAMPRLLASLKLTFSVLPGLYRGLAGLAFVLADHARLTGSEVSRQAAIRSARAIYKYAIPHGAGVRFLGDQLLRYSAELWSGSAGVLMALNQVLAPHPDGLFAVADRPPADPADRPARAGIEAAHA